MHLSIMCQILATLLLYNICVISWIACGHVTSSLFRLSAPLTMLTDSGSTCPEASDETVGSFKTSRFDTKVS